MNMKTDRVLSIFLWLVSLHSLLVGIGLIFLPSSAFEFLGFEPTFDRFFSAQGGVFHISMAVCYAFAAYDLIRYKQLILFSIIVKFIATVFLTIYFVIISSQLLIVLSAVSDFLMGICLLYLFNLLNKELYFNQKLL